MTRKITKEIATAWISRRPLKRGNTRTDGRSVWLHGNLIAWREAEPLTWCFTLAGWPTVTTRERLNGLLDAIGAPMAGFCQRKGKQIFVGLNGDERQITHNEVIRIRF